MTTLRQHRAEGYGLNIESLPKSGVEAVRIGSTYFYTGKPCKHGHVAARFTKGGSCTWCARSISAARYGKEFTGISVVARANEERSEAVKSKQLTYITSKPCPKGHRLRWTASTNCVECDKASRERRAEKLASDRITKLYGLNEAAHESIFIKQNKSCAICCKPAGHRRELHVDHCHKTNVVRGLLCSCCNQALGLFQDNPDLMLFAAEYVKNE
jgi:hypothetical protein